MNVIIQNNLATSPGFEILNPKILVVLPKNSSGTAVNGTLYRDIKTRDEASTLFGANSPINDAIQTYFDFINPNGRSRKVGRFKTTINAIGYDVTGTVGVQNIALTGTPVDGKIVLYFGSQQKHTVIIETLSTDTLAGIATKIANVLNAFTYSTFIATTSTSNVIITASMAGEWFNNLPYMILSNTSGLTLTKTTTTAGVGTMDLSEVTNTIKPYKFHFIHIPYTQVTNAIKEFVQGRAELTINKSLSGFLYYGKFSDTITGHADNIELDQSRKAIVYVIQKQDKQQESEYNICIKSMLSVACKMAEYTISDYVAKAEVNNGIGGAQFTAQTMVGSILPLSTTYTLDQEWSSTEIDQLKELDCIYFTNNNARTAVIFAKENVTYSISLEGEIPNIRTVAEQNVTMQSVGIQAENLISEYEGSTLQKGNNVINRTTQISDQQIRSSLLAHFIKLGSIDEENDIVYAWFANDAISVQKYINEVDKTLAINYVSGTVSLSEFSTIIGSLTQIFINSVFGK